MNIEDFSKAIEVLDAANVPLEDRMLAFTGKDGNTYILDKDSPPEVVNQLPEHMLWMII